MRTSLFVLLLSALTVQAQAAQAELYGIVRDMAGLPVSAADIELVHPLTGFKSKLKTTATGSFHYFAVPVGTYDITASKEGFLATSQSGVNIHTGDHVAIDLILQIGGINQTMEVNAAPALLETTRGTASTLVEQRKVVALPLDGRNFIPLIAIAPGVNLPYGSTLPRINGSRPRTSEYLYDGISVLQPEPGQVAYFPIIDAIEEFRVETNSYSAEYGRSNGGIVMVNLKSGTNALHGTLFEFFRNEVLNARNLFAPAGPKPRFRRNQPGFVLSGPVHRNRTFFLVDWQGTRLNTGVIRTSTVPTQLEQQGIFRTPIFDPATTRRTPFPSNIIPRTRFDANALNRYPAPDTTGTANNYRRIGNDEVTQNQADARVDQHIAQSHRLFARYAYFRDISKPTTPLPDGSGNITSGILGNTLTRADSLATEHTWSLRTDAVNQLRFGYTRRALTRTSEYPATLPTFDISGYQQLGPAASTNARLNTAVTQFAEIFATVRGRHSWKAGADIRMEAMDVLQPANPSGNFQFTNTFTSGLSAANTPVAGTGNSFASFLLGQVTKYTLDSQPEILKPRATIAEFFVQDDWRVSSRLTLNLGVRYTLNMPSTVISDRAAVFNLKTQQLDFLGQNGNPRTARNLEKLNFGPRSALAFKITNSLALRAGYGLTWIEQAGITTPFTTPLFPFIQTISEQSLDNIVPAFKLSERPHVRLEPVSADTGLGQGVFAVQRDNGSGYAQQWNLTLQKTFATNWSLQAGYLGSKLTRLGVPDINLNQLPVALLSLGAQLTEQVANPFFGELPARSPLGTPTIARNQLLRAYPRFTSVTLYRNNIGHSTYHSLQARLERRLSKTFTISAAYTLSRLIDDAGAVFNAALLTGPVTNYNAADSFNKRLEKDVSDGNIPHIFSSAGVWTLPRGWQLAAVVRLQSGSPLAVTQAVNLNAFAGFGIQRPNRLADPTLPGGEQSTGRWFNTGAFFQASQFTLGSSSRNPVVGPGYQTFDLMLGKTFPIKERVKIEIRAESFNTLNRAPLGNPNTSFGNTAFGTITTAGDPRVFELALKVHF